MELKTLNPELGALALAKSLLSHIETVDDMDEFLLFPPDLFAYTSLIFSVSGAYRLIVSPPFPGTWMPLENEHMRDFSEFAEGNEDNFQDVLGFVYKLFKVPGHKISELLRKKIRPSKKKEILTLYKDIQKNKVEELSVLKVELSGTLSRIINGESLYHTHREIFYNLNFPEEFWTIIDQFENLSATDKEHCTRRLNRLLLETAYPNEIGTSLTWEKHVRNVGLSWRKNLAGFDNEDLKNFETIKARKAVRDLDNLIDRISNFENLVKKCERLKEMPGELAKYRLQASKRDMTVIEAATGLTEKELLNEKNSVKAINNIQLDRLKAISEIREKLRSRVEDERYVPRAVKRYWDSFKEGIGPLGEGNIRTLLCESGSFYERLDSWQRFISLVSLHAIADECCIGWGTKRPLKFLREGPSGSRKSHVQEFAEDLLNDFGSLSTISNDRCRILPKRHTAEVGITLRSISCNLGFDRSSVEVKWRMDHIDRESDKRHFPRQSLNVLLLPFPLEIRGTDFKKKEVPVKSHQESQAFFEYDPDFIFSRDHFQNSLRQILAKARSEVGRVDLVVLPETAISVEGIEILEQTLVEGDNPVRAYIAGVRETGEIFNRNAVYFKQAEVADNRWCFAPAIKNEEQRIKVELDKIRKVHGVSSEIYRYAEEDLLRLRKKYTQYKHHRWKLDRSQIIQYQLGDALSPAKDWWEAIEIGSREINFINFGEQLTICPLICEDLARQEPIADVMRTVGPSLIVAILMDGPQILQRWAGRYASVLADDPGSAVITLTSFGMVRRSFVKGMKPSRVVALWSSPDLKQEIELDDGAGGVLLSLSLGEKKEKTSDGRQEITGTTSLSLTGIYQIELGDFERAKSYLKC